MRPRLWACGNDRGRPDYLRLAGSPRDCERHAWADDDAADDDGIPPSRPLGSFPSGTAARSRRRASRPELLNLEQRAAQPRLAPAANRRRSRGSGRRRALELGGVGLGPPDLVRTTGPVPTEGGTEPCRDESTPRVFVKRDIADARDGLLKRRTSGVGCAKGSEPRTGKRDSSHQYVEADLSMKEAALRCVEDPAPQPLRFTVTDRLLDFLEAL